MSSSSASGFSDFGGSGGGGGGATQTLAAEIIAGRSSDTQGALEYALGNDATGDMVRGQRLWSRGPSDPFDTGWIPVKLIADRGAVTWIVAGGSPGELTYTDIPFKSVDRVQLRAAAAAGQKMTWRDLAVSFYKNGSPIETINAPDASGPLAHITADGSNGGASRGLDVRASTPGADRLVLSALVRLESADVPASDAVGGQVFIFTS